VAVGTCSVSITPGITRLRANTIARAVHGIVNSLKLGHGRWCWLTMASSRLLPTKCEYGKATTYVH